MHGARRPRPRWAGQVPEVPDFPWEKSRHWRHRNRRRPTATCAYAADRSSLSHCSDSNKQVGRPPVYRVTLTEHGQWSVFWDTGF